MLYKSMINRLVNFNFFGFAFPKRLLLHISFWAAYLFIFPFFMLITVYQGSSIKFAMVTNTLFLLPQMLITYTFLYEILPNLWLGKTRKFLYSLVVFLILTLLFIYAFRYFVLVPFRTGHFEVFPSFKKVFTSNNYFLILTITGFASVIKFYRNWNQKEQSNQLLIQENTKAKLQLLKSQIHPHFLFNTLNNLYALTLKHSNKSIEVVDKLSNLLKYMLNECSMPQIMINKEIEMLNNYIELEKLRYGKRLIVIFEVEGEVKNKEIAPLLMLPFLENAFKHGSAEVLGIAQINIKITVREGKLNFVISNNFISGKNLNSNQLAGIGLKNVEKRLKLLYNNDYSLAFKSQKDIFLVKMNIPIY